MKLPHKPVFLLFLAYATINMASCKDGNLFATAPGEYDGILLKKEAPRSRQITIQGSITMPSSRELQLHIRSSAEPEANWDISCYAVSTGQINVKLANENLTLMREAGGDACFSSKLADATTKLRLCFDGKELSMAYYPGADRELIFALNRHVDSEHPVLEAPRSFKVSELLEMGKNKSFTSRLQFQKSVASRLESQAAHLDLLPHLSMGGILGSMTLQWGGLLGVVGDVAPFLIPSNWINANAAKWRSNADYQAWLLMKADSGLIAEGMAYVILRDQAALASLASYEAPLTEMLEMVQEKEILGLVTIGSANQFKLLLTSLQEMQRRLEQVILKEKRALALAVGLVNPDGIAAILQDTELSPENPLTYNLDELQNLAISRSIELRQVDSLMHVARAQVMNRWFGWISPNGGNIGFGLPSAIAAAEMSITELMTQREQLQSSLLQKVENSADELTAAARAYAVAKDSAVLLKQRVDLLHEGMVTGLAVSTTELQLALQDQMKGDNDLINAKFTYFAAVGKINRMLMSGPYLDILTRASVNVEGNQR